VERDTLHIIQVQAAGLAESTELVPGIWWNAHPAQALHLASEGLLDSEKWYFFLGYTGWSPGQLESEYDEHYWIPGPCSHRFLPMDGLDNQWSDFLTGLGTPYDWLIRAPSHPSLN